MADDDYGIDDPESGGATDRRRRRGQRQPYGYVHQQLRYPCPLFEISFIGADSAEFFIAAEDDKLPLDVIGIRFYVYPAEDDPPELGSGYLEAGFVEGEGWYATATDLERDAPYKVFATYVAPRAESHECENGALDFTPGIACPDLTSPAPEQLIEFVGSVDFAWDAVAFADAYDVYIWADGDAPPVEPTETVAGTTLNYSGFTSLGTINWKVDAVVGEDTSDGCAAGIFTLLIPCPDPIAPGLGEETNPFLPVTFTWAAVEGATSYNLYVWPTGDPEPEDPTVTVAGLSYETDSLTPGTNYSWRVTAVVGSLESEGCGASTFITGDVYNLTSPPYPIIVVEGVDALQASVQKVVHLTSPMDAVDAVQAVLIDGELRPVLIQYVMEDEAVDASQAELLGGELDVVLLQYEVPDEAVDAAQAVLLEGSLQAKLIVYQNYPDEAVEASQAVLLGGVLSS